jgi:hypothetical protein
MKFVEAVVIQRHVHQQYYLVEDNSDMSKTLPKFIPWHSFRILKPRGVINLSLLNHSRLVGRWKTYHWLSFEVGSVSLQNAILLNKIKHSLLGNLNLHVQRNIVYSDAYQESVTPCRAYMPCLATHPVWSDRDTPNRDTPLHCPNEIVFPSPGSTPQWWEVSHIFVRVYVGIYANCTHNTHYSVGDGERALWHPYS